MHNMHTYNTQAYIKNRHLGHVLITWFKNKKQTKEKQEWLASPKTQNKLNNTETACDDTSKYQHSSTPRATSHTQGTESKIHELLSLFSKKITTRLNERAVCLYIPGLCSILQLWLSRPNAFSKRFRLKGFSYNEKLLSIVDSCPVLRLTIFLLIFFKF